MGFGKVDTAKIENKKYPIKFQNTADAYVRPTDWLALPTITAGEQKFVGLHAVYNESSNFVAFVCSGAYVVDWGDGVTDNQAAGTTAQHSYTYANTVLSTATTAGGYKMAIVTITPSSGAQLTQINLQIKHNQSGLNKYNAGWLDIAIQADSLVDLRVGNAAYSTTVASNVNFSNLEQFNLISSNLANCTGLFYNCTALRNVVNLSIRAQATVYYTATSNVSLDTINYTGHGLVDGEGVFIISTVSGGIAVGSIYFVRDAAADSFKVSTTLGGSAVNISGTSGTVVYATGIMRNAFYNCYSLQTIPLINTSTVATFSYMFYGCNSLQTIPLINTAAGTNFSYMLYNCNSLQTIPLINTSAGTNFTNMFYGCYSLQTIPLINTAAGTNFSYMFYGCNSLQTIPLINTAAGTDFSYMFYNCNSLQTIPLINTAAGTDFSYMFYNCNSLQTIPLINTAAGTNLGFGNMFYGCNSLQTIPLINTSAATSFDSIFQNCKSLQTIPLLNTSLVTNWTDAFYGCYSLIELPALNTSAATNFDGIFADCYSLKTIPLLNTTAVTNWNNAFNACSSLERIPAISMTGGVSLTGTFSNCAALQRVEIVGIKNSISFASCKLSATALDEIYTNLATVTAKTITVTSNWGTSADTPSIATGKGWTVTGS